jgi:hypothetical protein
MTSFAYAGHLGHASSSTTPLRACSKRLPQHSASTRSCGSTRAALDSPSRSGFVSRNLTSRHSGGLLFRQPSDVALCYALLSVGLVAGGMLAGGGAGVAVVLGLLGLAGVLASVSVLLCGRVMQDVVNDGEVDSWDEWDAQSNRPLPGTPCDDFGQDNPQPVCTRRPR